LLPVPPPNAQDAHKACGWTAIRFVANNPGLWAFHCHIDWHMTIGMATVFDVSSSQLWTSSASGGDSNGSTAVLPVDYGTCGFINSRTVNPRVNSAPSDSGANDGSSSNSSVQTVILSLSGFTVLIIFTNLFSFVVGAVLMDRLGGGLVSRKSNAADDSDTSPNTTSAGVEVVSSGSHTNNANTDTVDMNESFTVQNNTSIVQHEVIEVTSSSPNTNY